MNWRRSLAFTAVASLVAVFMAAGPAISQVPSRLFGTLSSGAAKPVLVNSDGTMAVSLAAGSSMTSPFTFNQNGIGTTSADGVRLKNSTAAAAGAQQYSARLCTEGQGWKTDATAASQAVAWCIETRPVQGSSAPVPTLSFGSSVAGGAYTEIALLGGTSAASPGWSMTQGASGYNITSTGFFRSSSFGTRIQMPADAEVDVLANGVLRNGGIRSTIIVEANTGAKTPTALENGECNTNTGDSDGSTYTLLNDPTVGSRGCVIVTAAQTITVTASAGETLYFGATACGTSLTSNVVGSTADFVAATGGSGAIWVTRGAAGTWVCTP